MEGNTVRTTREAAMDVLYDEFVINAPWAGGRDLRRSMSEIDRLLRRINAGDTKIYSDHFALWVKVIDAV